MLWKLYKGFGGEGIICLILHLLFFEFVLDIHFDPEWFILIFVFSSILYYKVFNNMSGVSPEAIRNCHFVYPFLGSVTDRYVNGYFFIPMIHVPKAFFMTKKLEVTLFHSLIHLFPLATICMLMAAVAGFICWIVETRSNTEQFPKSFIEGL